MVIFNKDVSFACVGEWLHCRAISYFISAADSLKKVNLWLPFAVKCQCVEFGVFQLRFLTATLTPEWNSTDEPREHFSWWKHYKPLKKPHKPLQPLHNLWWALQLIVNGFHYILWPRFIMAAIRFHWLTVVNISSRLQTEKTTLSDNNNHAYTSTFHFICTLMSWIIHRNIQWWTFLFKMCVYDTS